MPVDAPVTIAKDRVLDISISCRSAFEPNPCFPISFRRPQGTDFLPGICLARCGKGALDESAALARQERQSMRQRAGSQNRTWPRRHHQARRLGQLRSDRHLFDGGMPSMEKGDALGHETMGE